jgi:hypothetical protein
MIWILVMYFALALSIHFVHSQFKVYRFAKRTLSGKKSNIFLTVSGISNERKHSYDKPS